MKILIVGDAGSIFIKQYIEYVLTDAKKHDVVLLQEGTVIPDYLAFYQSRGVAVEPLVFAKNRLIYKLPVIRSFLGAKIWCSMICKKYGSFDLIHVHGANRSRGNIGLYLHKHTTRTAISVWGDEIFRKDTRTLKKYRKYYDLADNITVSTAAMLRKFNDVYENSYQSRISINKFAIGAFDLIDRIRETVSKEELCRDFGIPHPEKRVILVGHNGREAQRHKELTELLHGLSQEQRDGITLVYTMTYGVKNAQYLEELEQSIQSLHCDYVILRDFLNEDKIARLRCLCEILLHAQLTDAFSASIQECLYSGAVVFNGSWLRYEDLPDYENRMISYDTMEELAAKLGEVLDDYDTYRERFHTNRSILRSISSREVTTAAWKNALHL